MKLIVTIPALNEEKTIGKVIREVPRDIPGIDQVLVMVLSDGSKDDTVKVAKEAGADIVLEHKENKGLAITFKNLLEEAVLSGADVIVNTDADNHYNQKKIADMAQPIITGEADIVIGGRRVQELEEMPWLNKYGNRMGSFVTSKLVGLPVMDVSSGFRAYSKEAAQKLYVYSGHTYTHTTLFSAADHKLTIKEMPIRARKVARKSRLIKSIPNHIYNAGSVIIRNVVLFKPMRVFSVFGAMLLIVGMFLIGRFGYYFIAGEGDGHIQSLIAAAIFMLIGFQTIVIGLIASSVSWNRKIVEEVLYRMRKKEVDEVNKK